MMSPRHAITQLRSNLKDLENSDQQQLIQDDLYLALWLNLTRFDVKKAEAAVRDASQWWEARDVPSIAQETIPLALASKLPIYFDFKSPDGLPFVYVRLTSVDTRGLLEDYNIADIARHIIQRAFQGLNMTLEAYRERYGKLGDEAMKSVMAAPAIVDMHGFSRKHIPPMKAINVFVQTALEGLKFPSTARTAYIIGVSKFILVFLKPIVAIINAFGVNVKVYGTDEKSWGADIYKLFDKKVLDEFRQQAIVLENAIEQRRQIS